MGNKTSSPSPARDAVDWSTIRQSARSFTFEELSHYSRSGINPYTIEIVHALCSQLTISPSAKRDLAAAREKLPPVADSSMHRVLLDLIASGPGLIALGICGILNESFRQESLAIVFVVLAGSSAVPDDLRPADDSWAELNQLCGKLQLPSTFHDLVERYTRLESVNGSIAAEALGETQSAGLNNAGPRLVVHGLQAMSALCSREVKTPMIAFAGHHAGWCAAVAEWMFDLKIQITSQDGRVVYSNCEGHEELMQLTLAFQNPGVPCDGSEPLKDLPLPTND